MIETLSRLKQFLKRPFFTDPRTLLWLWLLLALGSALIKFHKCNNFLIFNMFFGIRGIRRLFTLLMQSILIRIIMVRSSV